MCIFASMAFGTVSQSEPCSTLPSPCQNSYQTWWELESAPGNAAPHTGEVYVFTQPGTYVFWQIEQIENEGNASTHVISRDTFEVGTPPDIYEEEYEICHGDSFLPLPGTIPVDWNIAPILGYSKYSVRTTNEYCMTTEYFDVYAYQCDFGSATPAKGLGIPASSEDIRPDDCDIYLPSAVSPDSNGINDTYEVGLGQDCWVEEFMVADRWGGIVANIHPWNPADTPSGNYVVKVVVRTADGRRLVRYGPLKVF